jgi:hypothetical protein
MGLILTLLLELLVALLRLLLLPIVFLIAFCKGQRASKRKKNEWSPWVARSPGTGGVRDQAGRICISSDFASRLSHLRH